MLAHALSYPFQTPPAYGEALDVRPGLSWIRHSLPMALDHINVWLLSDDRQCVIVDTGINRRSTRHAWQRLLDSRAHEKTVSCVIATHLHPDHCGLAGWLTREHDCPLYMTRTEYLLCRTLCYDSSLEIPAEAIQFYRAAGMSEDQLKKYGRVYGGFGRAVSALPPSYRRMQDGDRLELAGDEWEVMVGTGHSPEHACLYNATHNTLISGDQILPRISSIVAVWPTEPESNPLSDWLDSCRSMHTRIPAGALVLPSHGLPFHGAQARLSELIDHHEQLIEQLHDKCREPQRVIDLFDLLFNSSIDDGNLVMAIGEAVAHLNYLRHEGRMQRTSDAHGVDWYSST